MDTEDIVVRIADKKDIVYVDTILQQMEMSAKLRGTGISKRSPDDIIDKMCNGKAVIAFTKDHTWVGFAYIQVWSDGEFVSNSGMIVHPDHRGEGIARMIKKKILWLSKKKYPHAKIFSITTAAAMMKLNTAMGFVPVVFDDVTHDEHFWQGCSSCVNYPILQSKQYHNCICCAMMLSPMKKEKQYLPQPGNTRNIAAHA